VFGHLAGITSLALTERNVSYSIKLVCECCVTFSFSSFFRVRFRALHERELAIAASDDDIVVERTHVRVVLRCMYERVE